MEQYIKKSALVAEIERLFEKADNSLGEYRNGAEHTLISIKDFLDTIEVKEIGVDIGSPEGDIGIKTIWDGDKIVNNKAQKRESV